VQARSLPARLAFREPVSDTEEGLIRGCFEYPWDDARFLIFADWLEENDLPEVATYVRKSLNWADHWRSPPEAVRGYWESRFGRVVAERCGYLRGFPSVLNVLLRDWANGVAESSRIFWGLNLRGFFVDGFIEFLASEELANYSALSLNPIRTESDGLTIQQLFSSRRVMNRINALDHLCAFKLTDNLLGQLNVETLLQSIQFRQLESLVLEGNHIGSIDFFFRPEWQHLCTIRSLDLAANQAEINLFPDGNKFRLFPNLQYLRLSWNQVYIRRNDAEAPIFPELRELHMIGCNLFNENIEAMAESNHFPRLERLNLSTNQRLSAPALKALLETDSMPYLNALYLTGPSLSKKERKTFTALAEKKKIDLRF